MSFKYFSGFCFENEMELFDEYICKNDFSVAGFSYGAIKAFEYVYNCDKRVDLLQLFSPAFFQTMDKKTKRLQLIFFKKDENEYIKSFLKNVSYPLDVDLKKYFKKGTVDQLDKLLNYTWDKDKLEKLVKKGVKIEVFIGEKDKIIDSKIAKEFFKDFATVYYIKKKGHIL